jgi:hypothetical protein
MSVADYYRKLFVFPKYDFNYRWGELGLDYCGGGL